MEDSNVEEGVIPAAGLKGSDLNNRVSRGEMSVSAIARLMGLATSTEVKTLEGKLDLVTAKMALVGSKLDKVLAEFETLPRGGDVDRIEVALAKLSELLRKE
jgi:hypothetical protein